MTHHGQPWRGLLLSVCAGLVVAGMAAPARAQNAPPQSSGSYQAPTNPDFMLGRPRATLGVRGEWVMASANSDIFDFVTDQLTLDKSSFHAPGFGMELGFSLSERLDVIAGFDIAKSTSSSEYRAFIDNQGLPIEQTTSLRQSNLFGALKFSIIPRGRSVSRFAWIPSTIVPYVGAGGGLIKYDFKQNGDFVDFADYHVFTEDFRSQGWTPTVHVFGGTDLQIYKSMFLSLEGRYQWAHATLDKDFIDFEPMDLGGFRFGAGFHIMF
jgi:hypothetical protein